MKKAFLFVLILALGAVPTFAQGDPTNTVSFNGFSFSFDPALAANVNITQFAGDPVDLDQPGGPQPPYTEFLLYNDLPAPESFFDGAGGIRVYRVADMAGYTEYETRLQALQTLLTDRPDFAQFGPTADNPSGTALPFLPVFAAAQVIRARAVYVETPAVLGISYVTAYRQDAYPFLGNEFIYTFQGFTPDGQFYVSAIFRLDTTLFPAEVPADFDYEAFIENLSTYMEESVATLNAGVPEDFTPSLATLDAIVQSFSFEAMG